MRNLLLVRRTFAATSLVLALGLPAAIHAQDMETETFSSAALEHEGQTINNPLWSGIAAPYTTGVDLRTTFSNRPQNETSIAANRYNALQVVGGMNDYSVLASGFGGNGVVYSNDGGLTFTHLNPVPGGGVALMPGWSNAGGDPAIDFDSGNRAFYTHLGIGTGGANNFQRNNGVFCASSNTGGATWNPTVAVAANTFVVGGPNIQFEDKPYVAADDHLTSPFQDRLYVTWTRFYPGVHPNGANGGGDIMCARSADNGATWASVRLTTLANEPSNTGTGTIGSSFVQFSEPAAGPDGRVNVVYWFGGRLNHQSSTDGGVTWSAANQPFGAAFNVASVASPLPNETFRNPPVPNIECDPTRPSNVYVVGVDDDDTPAAADGANVFFTRSVDGGLTWAARVKLNDDNLTRNQAFAWMAVNDQGDIGVIWYDTRNDGLNHLLDVYGTISKDGGLTWGPNFRVTDTNFEPNTGQFGGNTFFGDYNGMHGGPCSFHMLWTDTRTGVAPEQEIYYDRTAATAEATVSCPQDVETTHNFDPQLPFTIRNTGDCADEFDYSLTDTQGWIIATDFPAIGSVTLAPGGSFVITATFHTPVDCQVMETSVATFTATPDHNPAGTDNCQMTITCSHPTATQVSNLSGQTGPDWAELSFTLPDEDGLAGVHVYRTIGSSDVYERVTSTPLALDGRLTYTYTDRGLTPGVTYRYALGLVQFGGGELRVGLLTLQTGGRAEFALGRPYPNPTRAGFSVDVANPAEGEASLRVVDISGRVIREIHRGYLPAGVTTLRWNGTDARGGKVGVGIYFLRYEAGGRAATQRAVIVQ